MIQYIVSLDIQDNIFDEFCTWLKDHIQEVLQFEGFINAKIFEENDLDEQKRKLIVIYELDNRKNLNEYLENHAPAIRNKTIEKFGTQVTANRKFVEFKDQFKK